MKKYHSYLVISMLAAPLFFSLTACAPVRPATPANYASQDLNIHEKLSDTADAVEQSLRTLAQAQKMETMNAINTACLVTAKGGMGGKATLDWSGPIEPLLCEVARLTNYRVKILGNPSPIPIIVSISAKERVIADVLKDAGLQAGKHANLIVYPGSRIIELRYAAV